MSIESQVIHPTLNYVGYFDALTFDKKSKKVVLIDWKSSEKVKTSIKYMYEAPLQVAAYVGALNQDSRYSFQIENAQLVVAFKNGQEAAIFKIGKAALVKYWVQWVERCQMYQKLIK